MKKYLSRRYISSLVITTIVVLAVADILPAWSGYIASVVLLLLIYYLTGRGSRR